MRRIRCTARAEVVACDVGRPEIPQRVRVAIEVKCTEYLLVHIDRRVYVYVV